MSDTEINAVEVVETPAQFKTVVEAIEKMSVLELHELVKFLEKKFGVSASAVAVAAPAGRRPLTSSRMLCERMILEHE
jgi:ribosomal protein L7/L12